MSNAKPFHTVAEAVRVEYIKDTDELYLVFQVVDADFKKRIKNDWTEDVELLLVDKKLTIAKENA